MKATSHFIMAHLLYASLQKRGVFLNRIAFVYGNIEPDQTPVMWFHPHFGKYCPRMVSEISEELSQTPLSSSGRVGANYSKELGMLCHFLCDYFCFAHNDEFPGNIRQHVAYENELDSYLRSRCLDLLDIDGAMELSLYPSSSSLIDSLEDSHRDYLKAGFSLHNDMTFAFDACMSAILSTVSLSKQLPAAAFSLELDDFISSLKGYATGNSLVFRMFMFKYKNHDLFFIPDLMPPIGAFS